MTRTMQNLRRRRAGSEEHSTTTSEEEPEQFDQLNPIFRIVTLYELLMHGQWQYVSRFLRNRKTELVLGMYIGAAFECVRFICVITLVIMLVMMRLSVLVELQSDLIVGNIVWIGTMNSFAFWIAVLLCFAIVIQFGMYQCKSPMRVVISTAFNFVLSVLLIGAVIHIVVLMVNSDAFIKEALYKHVLRPQNTMSTLSGYETRDRCCGIDGPSDYTKSHILDFTNPLTNRSVRVPLTREWAVDDTHVFYSLPISCCSKLARGGGVCSQRNLTDEEFGELNAFKAGQQWDMMLKYFTMPEDGSFHAKGCFQDISATVTHHSIVVLVTLVIFSIFTALTIAFVIVYLLYHDGVGHVVSDYKMFGVERNTGVHFLTSLDLIDNGFQDDFSIIEFLRKSDFDNFIAADKVDHVGHRRDVEI